MKCFLLSVLVLSCPAAFADEGMWLFNSVPKDPLAARFKFTPTQGLLDHLRLSSVKFGGGSGSFVSQQGLIFTNHHVASGCIQNVSSKEHNYMRDGFYAATQGEELKCPGLEVQVLLEITDVTAKVAAAVQAKPDSAEAAQQRRAAMSALEKACVAEHGGACNVVTLYSGALYHLYRYKKHSDVRLVFAPEEAIAFFGGDPDNFTYPRYDLDITFLRAYENDQPASTPNYLKWSRSGVKDGELALVSGHPGSTDRFITLAQFAYMRDVSYPRNLKMLKAIIDSLEAIRRGERGEQAGGAREAVWRRELVQGPRRRVQGAGRRAAVCGEEADRGQVAGRDRGERQGAGRSGQGV